jgi:tetratricopeptide (TPR) repeat protein
VSLLLEALKKAEAAKRRDDEGGGDTPAAEPPPAPAAPRITPAHELELIDDEIAQAARFAGLDVPEPTPFVAPPASPGSEAARLLFDAKKPAARPSSLTWLLGSGALLLLCVGGWVVWQLSSLDSGRSAPSIPAAASVAASMNTPTAEPVQPPVEQSPVAVATPAATAPAAEPAAPSRPALPVAALTAPAVPDSSRFLSGQLTANPPAVEAPAPAPAAAPIRITRNAPAVPQDVADGYAAFQAGEFDRARVAYERALRADPRNPDALHGLAALAQHRRDEAGVRQLMRRIAEVDPSDTAARVALSDNVDPAVQEARLLDIAAAQPKSAAAAFALGTLYASQARWREAQQAYFNAYTLAPEQPDHAYNLAVSLDQLRQPRLALQYYREAMSLRAQRAAAFDADAVATRIQSLEAR